MSFEYLISTDEIVKIERSAKVVKRTSLYEKGFSFQKYSRLLDLMQENGDIATNQATTEPVLSRLLLPSYLQTKKARVAILLGKYAEALMVMNCNEDDSFNRNFARKARFGRKSQKDHLNNFTAISTGSAKTRNNYPMHYQYTESQRDIVWVDKRDVSQLLTVPKKHGAIAGLQLKVSYDWKNIKGKLTQYYYPILYLSMNDDWDDLNEYINKKKDEGDPEFQKVRLLEMDDYSNELLEQLSFFEAQLVKLINGEISIKYLIDQSIAERETAIGHAISKLPKMESEYLISAEVLHEAKEREQRENDERIRKKLRDLGRYMLDNG